MMLGMIEMKLLTNTSMLLLTGGNYFATMKDVRTETIGLRVTVLLCAIYFAIGVINQIKNEAH